METATENLQTLTEMDVLMQNMTAMNEIVREMREIPELPSERIDPKEREAMDRVEMPEAGGVLLYFVNRPYPYKGFPFHEFVEKIDIMKKLLRAQLSGLYHGLRARNPLQLATLLLSPWLFRELTRAQVYMFWKLVQRFRIKPVRYCDAMRELYRAFSEAPKGERVRDANFREQLRDVVCMLLEFDNAYRFRFQDVAVEVDKVALAQNPRREILRLLDVLKSREKTQEVRDTWELFTFVARFYLPFDRALLRIVADVLNNMHTDAVALDAADLQFCAPRKDYTFSFMQRPDYVPPSTPLSTAPQVP